ncbi:hypothetical protein S1OALGB6SA_1936 [Olavius algarvensis spirochete endosymbiont]|nr:MAG: hypothetical protein [Olavius algarvensis spirochete endosymbiont]VDB00846.1 hypothetical protein S1OALGB6SA_1936 [Olavius algarvensis spirochete endosymbiont]
MHVLLAHVVADADVSALEKGPKAFNRIGVNATDNILTA